jgi:hypothetical protein
MALTDVLAPAQNGQFFAHLGGACGLSAAEARDAVAALGPAIAEKLKERATGDADAFEALVELIEDDGGTADINDVEAMTGAEAVKDGLAILADLYGSPAQAQAALAPLAPGLPDKQFAVLAGLATTSVLAALTASHAPQAAAALPATGESERGFFGTLITAMVQSAMKEAVRQVTPRKRRRKRTSYSSIFGSRKRTSRRRAKKPTLESIFAKILTGRR